MKQQDDKCLIIPYGAIIFRGHLLLCFSLSQAPLSQSDIIFLLFPMSTCYSVVQDTDVLLQCVGNRLGLKSGGQAVSLSSYIVYTVLGKDLKLSWLQCPCMKNRKHNRHGSKEMEADFSLVTRGSSGYRTNR